MTLEELLEHIPEHGKDIKLNCSSLLRQTELNEEQFWGTMVATSMATKNTELAEIVLKEASTRISPEGLNGSKIAAALMGMNNVYYRFTHLCSNKKYTTLPTSLRMNSLRSHGVDQNNFELWCLAVSAINGCGVCIDSHESKLREAGIEEGKILMSIRVAAVVSALSLLTP